MQRVLFGLLLVHMLFLSGRLFAGDQPVAQDELTRLKSEYADVFALRGTSKAEILTIAGILRMKPGIAIDQTAASTVSIPALAQWFISLRNRRVPPKMLFTSSTPLG
jgi:hypothetical protein